MKIFCCFALIVTIVSGFPATDNADYTSNGYGLPDSSGDFSGDGSGQQTLEVIEDQTIDVSGELIESSGYGSETDDSGDVASGSGTNDFPRIVEEILSSLDGSGVEDVQVFEKNGNEIIVARRKRSADAVQSSTEALPSTTVISTTTGSEATTVVTTLAPTNKTASDAVCQAMKSCYGSSDCGASGSCVGLFVGTCNCNACMSGFLCESDLACGGLKGACVNSTASNLSFCNCIEGYKVNGYKLYSDAVVELCDVKMCTKQSAEETCHGLPCNAGVCIC